MRSSDQSAQPAMDAFDAIPFSDRENARKNYERVSQKLSVALATTLPALLNDAPDPDAALLLFERLVNETGGEVARSMEQHPFLAHYAIAVFGTSRYLGETLIRNPELLQIFLREKRLDHSYSHEEFSEALARFRARSFERDGSLLLARFKRREYVRIMLRDILRIAPLAETTAEISALSDVLIEEALREAESTMEHRFGLPRHADEEGRTVNTPFAVLSLGKLGGNELNYSSDIDLLFLFGDGKEPPTAEISNREYFVRLAQQVTEILSRPTAEGAVFRIDLRLRPQGNEGELAIGLSQALHYYANVAHDWERQALIKVRYSAGNEALARGFIHQIQPQVYHEQVNFAAIKTALVTREKIDRKRRRQAVAVPGGDAIDVKIDRGGIRDIEFLVQCLQRMYGGAEPWLRSGGTLFSLQKLHDKRHIAGHDFHELTSAYTFFRHLEHRLQLRQGQQVHRLPTSESELLVLRRSMETLVPGTPSIPELTQAVRERMSAVADIYHRTIYQQQARQALEPSEGAFQLRSYPDAIADQSHQQMLAKLAEDTPQLSTVLRSAKPGSTARKNLLRFLSAAFSSSERYATTLRYEDTIARSISLFENSEYLTELLVRHPEEVSTLGEIASPRAGWGSDKLFNLTGETGFSGHDPVFTYVAHSSASHREKIAMLRRHFRHCMFASGARDVIEARPVYSSLAETTIAAEDAIVSAFGIAGPTKGLAVLALGRLGTREFDLLSDADLIFLCDERADRQELTSRAEELMQSLSAYTQEGLVFPVDTRLRPRGSEGELLVTPTQLGEYLATEAQPWEALMYTKARLITGDEKLGRRALVAVEALFRRFAMEGSFAEAVRQMRRRLEVASAPEKSIRTSPGALYDADFLSSFLLVKHDLRPKLGTLRDRLWRCASSGSLERRDAATLDHAAELCRTVEHVLRLVIGRNTRWLPSAEHARESVERLTRLILRRDFPDGLEPELLKTFKDVRQIYERVVR